MSDREARYERISKNYPFYYVEEWQVLEVHRHLEKISVDFAFYHLRDGELLGKNTFEFPLRDMEKWQKLLGKRVLIRNPCNYGENEIEVLEG
jgi:hypothetical protein